VTLAGGRAQYTLALMVAAGWRVVEATRAERAVLAANGITLERDMT
jgi:hypothetical protein